MGLTSQLGFWRVAFPGGMGQKEEGGNNTEKPVIGARQALTLSAHCAGMSSSGLVATP